MKDRNKGIGIKVRLAKSGVIQLVDRATGQWLASIRWRPRGEVWVELAEVVGKKIVGNLTNDRRK